MLSTPPPNPPIDGIHSGIPLRANRPGEAIHPYLHDVDGCRGGTSEKSREFTAAQGIIPCNINYCNTWSDTDTNSTHAEHDGETADKNAHSTESSTNAYPAPTRAAARRTVRIPASANHDGFGLLTVTLFWTCPVCGGPRGEPHDARSYDGSRILHCDGWRNPCGHIDYYDDVRNEARAAAREVGR